MSRSGPDEDLDISEENMRGADIINRACNEAIDLCFPGRRYADGSHVISDIALYDVWRECGDGLMSKAPATLIRAKDRTFRISAPRC